jgi:outer membrane protein assembly factor BamB
VFLPLIGAIVSAAAVSLPATASAQNWPRFRGENGTGVSQVRGIPVQWRESDYEWVIDLPGKGHSSPSIWGNRLFVTSGDEDSPGDESANRMLLCFDATTGEQLWRQTIQLSVDHLHKKNSNGSCTPAVDGERVYVAFADDTQYIFTAYDLDGNQLWSKDLGPFETQHGLGQSPMVIPELDLVVLANDQIGASFIAAFNRKTGEEVWRTPRKSRKTAYSTPMLLTLPGQKPQLICSSGAVGIAGLDPETGRELWSSGELPLRSVSSPVYGNGVVIATCGSGGVGKYMVAVDPTGAGDVSGTHIVWERDVSDKLPYVPTPIVLGPHLYLWTDQGIVVCVDMKTGETVNQKRTGGGNFSSSPLLIDGKLYNLSEAGEVIVVSATPELEILGTSQLGDGSHATMAVANNRLYIRGFHRLACLKAQ